MRGTLEERFWAKVDTAGDCWNWIGVKYPNGYGQLNVGGRMTLAHRIAFRLANGSLPDGLDIDHICRNRACVRASHLQAISHRENVRRGAIPGIMRARHASVIQCPAGHPYDEANTYRHLQQGYVARSCLTCKRERGKARTLKVQAARAAATDMRVATEPLKES